MELIGIITIALFVILAFMVLVAWLTMAQKYRGERWLAQFSYAHRGLHGREVPENSMAAFEAAAQKGYAIELDVRLSKDNEVMVFHDESLWRMAQQQGNVQDYTMAQLKAMRLAKSDQGIPSLRDVLMQVNGRVPILIELKSEGKAGMAEEKLWELLQGYAGRFAVQSFSPYALQWFRKNAPGVMRGQLSCSFKVGAEHISALKKFVVRNLLTNVIARPHFISYDVNSLGQSVLNRMHKDGIPILGWTVRSKAQQDGLSGIAAVIFEDYEPEVRV